MSETATATSPADNSPLPVAVVSPPKSLPYLSFALIGVLTLIFVVEQILAIDRPTHPLEPSIKTLIALGGLQQLLTIGQGQWWRMFTGPLLHVNPPHLVMNGAVLLLAGWALERAIGRLWFGAIFVIGALGGACGSLFFNPRNLVSVGASGAIMGLFAAILVISFRYTGQIRSLLQRRAFQVLIPSMLPLASAGHLAKVDYGAHAVGAVAGGVAAFFLSELWRENDLMPGFRWAAIAVILLGLAGAATGGVKIALSLIPPPPMPADDPSKLIPEEYLPKRDSDIHEASVWWYVAKYPDDPRSHYYKALFLLRKPDLTEAERELRIALDQKQMLDGRLAPAFKLTLQGSLALVLLDEHQADAARQAAAAACLDRSAAVFPKLQARGLCTSPN
jgi:rhomboid protease GluP